MTMEPKEGGGCPLIVERPIVGSVGIRTVGYMGTLPQYSVGTFGTCNFGHDSPGLDKMETHPRRLLGLVPRLVLISRSRETGLSIPEWKREAEFVCM